MAEAVAAILFDIDGTLITTGGASDRAWKRAFAELQGVEVNVGDFTGKGVPDPQVGLVSFRGAIGREPSGAEMAALMAVRHRYLPEEVESSPGYRVMPGVVETLERLSDERRLVGLITGNTEIAAHVKLARAEPQPLVQLRRLRLRRRRARRRLSQGARSCRARLGRQARPRRLRSRSATRRSTSRRVTAPGSRCSAPPPASTTREALREAGGDWVVASLAAGPLPF